MSALSFGRIYHRNIAGVNDIIYKLLYCYTVRTDRIAVCSSQGRYPSYKLNIDLVDIQTYRKYQLCSFRWRCDSMPVIPSKTGLSLHRTCSKVLYESSASILCQSDIKLLFKWRYFSFGNAFSLRLVMEGILFPVKLICSRLLLWGRLEVAKWPSTSLSSYLPWKLWKFANFFPAVNLIAF